MHPLYGLKALDRFDTKFIRKRWHLNLDILDKQVEPLHQHPYDHVVNGSRGSEPHRPIRISKAIIFQNTFDYKGVMGTFVSGTLYLSRVDLLDRWFIEIHPVTPSLENPVLISPWNTHRFEIHHRRSHFSMLDPISFISFLTGGRLGVKCLERDMKNF